MDENEIKYLEYLLRDTGAVPCSRWGRNSEDCAPVAIRLMQIMEDANGPVDDWREFLEFCMGLVVNDSDDVVTLLREHGTRDDLDRWADELGITRATPADAGCWVDGHWGQYALAHFIDKAADHGYRDTETPDVVDIARRHLATIGPSDAPDISDDEWQIMHDAADEVEQWMTENVAPEGYYFVWRHGECFMELDHWQHDPQRDGSGCTWCGAFAMVDADNLCEECWEES